MNTTIYVLIDMDDETVCGYTHKDDKTEAVTTYLKSKDYWDMVDYYNDGRISLTCKEYVESGRFRQDFRFTPVSWLGL